MADSSVMRAFYLSGLTFLTAADVQMLRLHRRSAVTEVGRGHTVTRLRSATATAPSESQHKARLFAKEINLLTKKK